MSVTSQKSYTVVSPPLVFVVDDDDVLRPALGSLLRSVGHSVQEFADPMDMLNHPSVRSAACVVLDVRLHGHSGLDVHARMAALGLEMPVIFITGHGDIPMSVRAMKAGAVDFFSKPFRHQELLDAISNAVSLNAERIERRNQLEGLQELFGSLTAREKQVMTGVTNGLMNKQIAWELAISEVTVKMHRSSVMRKMHAATAAELIRAGQQLQSLSAPANT